MAGARKPAPRRREPRRRSALDLYDLMPPFLRPGSRAWKHFQAAKIEFREGLRVALEEFIDESRRQSRRRTSELTRIRVQG